MSTENTAISSMWRLTLRLVLGVIFLILGIIGILIPVMPQVLFFVLAALMFFPRHRRLNVFLDRGEVRFARAVGWLRKIGIGHPDRECGAGPIPPDPIAPLDEQAYEPPPLERQRYPE